MLPRVSLRRVFPTIFLAAAVLAPTLASPSPAAPSPPSPEIWDPPAITVSPSHENTVDGSESVPSMVEAGRLLFLTRFNLVDGAGRPGATGDSKPTIRVDAEAPTFIRTAGPDASSCEGCHNQPATGGSGDFAVNVFVGAHFTDPPTRRIDPTVTSERNTIGVFGAGAVELLAREMTADLHAQRRRGREEAARTGRPVRVALASKGVRFGAILVRPDGTFGTDELEGVDDDLVIKPFGVKGVAISLREFTINALNQHHGMQAIERYGWEKTGRHDFDEDGVEVELTIGQISALTLFQASLPAPVRMEPQTPEERERLARGERLFRRAGCADCHVPALPLDSAVFTEPNPYNRPGNLLPADVSGPIELPLTLTDGPGGVFRGPDGRVYVAAFTDLKRHRICDEEDRHFCNETLRQDFVPTDEFLTAKLWDAGTSMPYGHRGDCTTLSEAIVHHSAEGAAARDAFLALPTDGKRDLIAFLRSLVVPGDERFHSPAAPSNGS